MRPPGGAFFLSDNSYFSVIGSYFINYVTNACFIFINIVILIKSSK